MTEATAPENADANPYWEGAAAHRLLIQQCGACGKVQFPPRHQCMNCWHEPLDWVESSGRGRIESVTVVRRAPLSSFRAAVPYAVAAICLAEGPRMITNLVGSGALEAQIGDAVEVQFQADESGRILPQFRLEPL